MKFVKKLIILVGKGGKGTVSIERNAFSTQCTLNTYDLPDLKCGEYVFALFGEGLQLRNLGSLGRVSTRFDLDETALDVLHCAVVYGDDVVLYGTNDSKKMWEGNMLDRIRSRQTRQTAKVASFEQKKSALTEGLVYSGRDKSIEDFFLNIQPQQRYFDDAIAEVNYYQADRAAALTSGDQSDIKAETAGALPPDKEESGFARPGDTAETAETLPPDKEERGFARPGDTAETAETRREEKEETVAAETTEAESTSVSRENLREAKAGGEVNTETAVPEVLPEETTEAAATPGTEEEAVAGPKEEEIEVSAEENKPQARQEKKEKPRGQTDERAAEAAEEAGAKDGSEAQKPESEPDTAGAGEEETVLSEDEVLLERPSDMEKAYLTSLGARGRRPELARCILGEAALRRPPETKFQGEVPARRDQSAETKPIPAQNPQTPAQVPQAGLTYVPQAAAPSPRQAAQPSVQVPPAAEIEPEDPKQSAARTVERPAAGPQSAFDAKQTDALSERIPMGNTAFVTAKQPVTLRRMRVAESPSLTPEAIAERTMERGRVTVLKKNDAPGAAAKKEAAMTAPTEVPAPAEGRVPPARSVTFYEQIERQLKELFAKYPREETLQKLMPDTEWARVDFDGKGKYYVVGLIGKNFVCYGVPARFTPEPPPELDGYCQWFPVRPGEPEGDGYWLMYQDAVTGESVKSVDLA